MEGWLSDKTPTPPRRSASHKDVTANHPTTPSLPIGGGELKMPSLAREENSLQWRDENGGIVHVLMQRTYLPTYSLTSITIC